MGKRRYELDTRVLTVFFFVAMPFVAFGSFIVVSLARAQLESATGATFEQRALETKLLIERYVGDQIAHLRLLSLDPDVRSALASPARGEPPKDPDAAWAKLLSSPLALRLKEMARGRAALKLVQVADAGGRVLASSARGGRLDQAEYPWYQAFARETEELPGPYVADIHRPSGGAMALLEIVYPVVTDDGRWLGSIRGLLDAADLYSVIAPVRIGRTGHAVLLRASDGLILASDEQEHVLRDVFPGFHSLQAKTALTSESDRREILQVFGGEGTSVPERRGYAVIAALQERTEAGERLIEPARLVGYSPVEQVPDVSWMVVVEQELGEATAPIQSVTRYLWIHFIGAFGTVILLALYFSFKLETPVIEEELHLHEEHLPASMRQAS